MGLLGLAVAVACWRAGEATCTPDRTDCKLRQVQIVFRHGDRSPVQHVAGLDRYDHGINPWWVPSLPVGDPCPPLRRAIWRGMRWIAAGV